jgi:hypothetical protein
MSTKRKTAKMKREALKRMRDQIVTAKSKGRSIKLAPKKSPKINPRGKYA